MDMEKTYSISDLVNTKRFAYKRKGELSRCVLCGCYSCISVFLANQINEWIKIDEKDEWKDEGICPFCGSPYILGESSDHPIGKELLLEMKKYYGV